MISIERMSDRRKYIALFSLIVLEALVYYRSIAFYFDGDSLFYFLFRLETLNDLTKYLTSIDVARQYRPLTHLIFAYVFYPLFNLDIPRYSFLSLGFHLLNTLLVFLILTKLLKKDLAVLAGTAFWGLNPVAIYVTHGLAFLPDFLYAFLYFLCTLLFLLYLESGRLLLGLTIILTFIFSLLSKEAAVTLPANLLLISFLFSDKSARLIFKRRQNPTLGILLLLILFVYLASLYRLKGGHLYDQGQTDNYRFTASLSSMISKFDLTLPALYLPFRHDSRTLSRQGFLLTAVAAPALLMLLGYVGRALWRQNRALLGGLLWFLISLSPVLFISPTGYIHNVYVPLMGLSIVVALFVNDISDYLTGKPRLRGFVLSYLILLVFLSLLVNQTIFLKTSWLPYYQEVAKNCVEDLRKIYHRLPQSPILYILRPWAEKEPVGWVLYKGELFKLVFRDKSIRVLFEDAGDVIPEEAARRGQVTVLAYNEKHLYDVTQSYLGELWNPSGYKLLNSVNGGNTSFDYSEYYPSYDFDTPGKRAVFVLPIVRKDELRVAMTTIAGARISFKIAQLTENSKLMVGTAMKFDLGDGAEGRIYFEHDGSRELIYKRFLDPAHNPSDRQWSDEVIDLGRFNGKHGSLIFECSSGPKGNTVADWYGWSTLKITNVSDMRPDGLR